MPGCERSVIVGSPTASAVKERVFVPVNGHRSLAEGQPVRYIDNIRERAIDMVLIEKAAKRVEEIAQNPSTFVTVGNI